jgi:DNA polymerase-1
MIGDVLALTGDSVDNIPGVAGLGRKTASGLIREFGGLDQLLAKVDTVKSDKMRAKLIAAREQILQNRQMVELDCHMDLPAPIDELKIRPDYPGLIEELEKCEFKSLLQEVQAEAAKAGTTTQVELQL